MARLAPHVSSGRLLIRRGCVPVAAELESPERIGRVIIRGADGKSAIKASCYLDATENGDLLPLAGAEWITGAEARSQTGEPSASPEANPRNVQAFSVCLLLEERAGENHVIPEPERYAFWHGYVPRLEPPWPGPLQAWAGLNPRTMEPMHFHAHGEQPGFLSGLVSRLDRDGRPDKVPLQKRCGRI
ncbi:MAG TPA: FAD-dependent oxidoreductase [Chthoniobacteraceae bacterium]|nr:FAD-dependent oxidoreductase [Chthoniobacteraceae bacterium]